MMPEQETITLDSIKALREKISKGEWDPLTKIRLERVQVESVDEGLKIINLGNDNESSLKFYANEIDTKYVYEGDVLSLDVTYHPNLKKPSAINAGHFRILEIYDMRSE